MVANRKPRPKRNTVDPAPIVPCEEEPEPRNDVAIAQRDAAVKQLRAVLALIDRKSFMSAADQIKLYRADAFVAESERW